MNMTNKDRNVGLDILRCIAIILVFLSHYNLLTDQRLFGLLGQMGGLGVDLFFALSGYLIGYQIFSALNNEAFSLKIFYVRRFLRILPNYFFVLALYFLVPFMRERPLTIPLWKFLTFTQNFNLIPSAFSHAWSLCIEEHFYLVLPLLSFFIIKKSLRAVWFIIIALLVAEIMIRGSIWFVYLRQAQENVGLLSMRLIYAPTFSRLDSLGLGVFLALLNSYYNHSWKRITKSGNLFLILGVVGYFFVAYIFQHATPKEFISNVLNYSLLALSSAALVISALSPNSILCKIRMPGAIGLATWSYGIYLIHKSIIHITQIILAQWELESSNWIMLTTSICLTLIGSCLLYSGIEKPFLKLRDRIGKVNSATLAFTGENNKVHLEVASK